MKLPFLHAAPERTLRKPAPTAMPTLEKSNVAALYRAARFGGDFFDFKTVERHLVFMLMDIAGRRTEALDIAAAAQETFHEEAAKLFGDCCVNEAEAAKDDPPFVVIRLMSKQHRSTRKQAKHSEVGELAI